MSMTVDEIYAEMREVRAPRSVPLQEVLGLTDDEVELINDILGWIDQDNVIDSVMEILDDLPRRDRVHLVAGIVIARLGFPVTISG